MPMAIRSSLIILSVLVASADAFLGVSSWIPSMSPLATRISLPHPVVTRLPLAQMRMQTDADKEAPESGINLSRRRALQILGGGGALVAARQISQGGTYTGTPDLTGKVAIVTGGNTGIGKQTCIRLASLGAEVILASRDEKRGKQAEEEVRQATGSAKVTSMQLDLASLASVERFAASFKAAHPKLDILVNNAGVMALPEREETADGFERQLGINHLGHFHLTNLLMPEILAAGKATGDARVISVSSEAHQLAFNGFDFSDVMARKSYDPWKVYAQSKLANVLFAKELERRLPADSGVSAASLHPGVIQTELGRSFFIPKELCEAAGSVNCKGQIPAPLLALSAPLLPLAVLFTKTPPQGAQTQVRLAADPALAGKLGGKFYSDCEETSPSSPAQDAEAARQLWEVSEQLTRRKTSI